MFTTVSGTIPVRINGGLRVKKMVVVISTVFLVLISLTQVAGAAEPGKFSGTVFGDYYYVAANHDASLKNLNGLWFRRIYFTYDQKLDERFSMRLRTDMSNSGIYAPSETMTPEVKDAYLKWTAGNTGVMLGISPTPTFQMIENLWGYRSVEMTPLDLAKFASSRDFGLAVKGKLGRSGKVYYHAMIGNGNSNKNEANKQKKVMGAVGAWLTDNLIVEGYADYDGRPDHKNRNTLQGFIAYRGEQARIGFMLAQQKRQDGVGNPDKSWTVWSAFATAKITDKTSVFARVDGLSDPNPDGAGISYLPFDPTAKSTFMLGGVDFQLSSQVHVIPNVEVVSYSVVNPGDPKPDSDVIPRVTVSYSF